MKSPVFFALGGVAAVALLAALPLHRPDGRVILNLIRGGTIGGDLTVNGDAGFNDISFHQATSTAASGAPALAFATNGAEFQVGTGPNADLYSDGSKVLTHGDLTVAGDISSSASVISVTALNGFRSSGNTSGLLQGFPADGASAVGTILRWGGGGTNASAKIASFQNATTEKAFVRQDGLVDGAVGASSGAWSVLFVGVAGEGTNGQGGYRPATTVSGSKFRQVTCSCAVAGNTGSTGIILSLMEDGSEVATTEINAGADTNACDDAAGTLLSGDFNYAFAAAKSYTLQFKTTTDCGLNPAGCHCDVDVVR